MIVYFLRASLAHFRRAYTLFLLTAFGVALGVASVVAIQIINLNAIGAFSAGIQAVSGEADLTVLGQSSTFSETLFPQVLGTQGVAAAWPLYRIQVAVPGNRPFFLQILGVDLLSPVNLPWRDLSDDLFMALFEKGSVAITPSLAKDKGWHLGDRIEVSSGTRRLALQIGSLIDFQKVNPLASRKLAVMDIAQAQSLLGIPGHIHQIDVQIGEEFQTAEVAQRLQQQLGLSVRVQTPEQRKNEAISLMSAFRLNLTALSLISLFVGLFLVYTSIQASLVRRRSEFGLLRSIGATRGQVFGLILGEVTLLGLLGVVAGLPLGYWVARSNVDMVNSTLTNVYLLQGIEAVQIPTWLYLLTTFIGIGGAIVGAFLPTLDMSRKDIKALLTPFTLHEKASSLALPLFGVSLTLQTATLIWFWWMGQNWKHSGFVLALCLLLGLSLLTPFVVQQTCKRIPIRSFGFGYSLRSLLARLQTSSFSVASLAIAISMLIGITLMIGSFRRTMEVWVETTVRADVYIAAESWHGQPEAVLNPELISALSSHPAVAEADRLRKIQVYIDQKPVSISGVDMDLQEGKRRFPLLWGDPKEALFQVQEQDAVLISEGLARRVGLTVGQVLEFSASGARVKRPIAGVFYDYSSEAGAVAMDLGAMERCFGDGGINGVSLYLKAGWEAEQVVDELKTHFAELPLRIRSNRRLREDIFKIFDQTFSVVRILQVMSLLIAVCGIMLALLILARSQVAELALYRALGAHPRQIFRIFLGKGLGMGLMGLGLGLAGGLLLALILIFIINRSYFGWTIQFHWPGSALAQAAIIILGAVTLTSLYPALRASRTPATELNRDDLQ